MHARPLSALLRSAGLAALAVMALALTGCSTLRGTPQRFAAPDEIVKAIDLTPADLALLVNSTSVSERNALQNQAIAVIDGAEGEKPMALSQWRDRAAQRLQLEAALSQVSEAVLRQIAAMGGAQQ